MLFPPAWKSWLEWHWGGSPNDGRTYHKRGKVAVPHPELIATVGEQQELYDAAWLILKKHGVVSYGTTYGLAMELSDRIGALRDRQHSLKKESL